MHERFDWSENEVTHYQRTGGTITRWGDATGTGTASGSATSYDYDLGEGESTEAASSPYYYKHNHGASGEAGEDHDYYSGTLNWTRHTATDGTVTYNVTMPGGNHTWGNSRGVHTSESDWYEAWYVPASDGVPEHIDSTGGATSDADVLWSTSYDHNVNYNGFHAQDRYTDPALYPASLPVREGSPVPAVGSGTTSGSSWSATASDTLEGGPWFPVGFGQPGPRPLLGLSVSYAQMFEAGAGGESSYNEIDGIVHPPPPWYQKAWEGVKETFSIVVHTFTGMTPAQLARFVVGTTVAIVGLFVAPVPTLMAMAIGGGFGALSGMAQAIDAGGSLSQVLGSALAGGLTGAADGALFGGAGKVLQAIGTPCAVFKAIGAGFGAMSAANAYNNLTDPRGPRYASAMVDIFGAGLAFAGAASAQCFVAGTQVVRWFEAPRGAASTGAGQAEEGASVGYVTLAAGAFCVAGFGAGAIRQRREEDDRRRQEEEVRRVLFGRNAPRNRVAADEDDEDDDLRAENARPLWAKSREDEPPNPEPWSQQVDRLCERLFNGDEEDGDLLTSEDEIFVPRGDHGVPLLGTSSAVAAPRALTGRDRAPLRALPSPVSGEGQGVRVRGTPRSTYSVRSEAARPARVGARWQRFLVAACLLLGCFFLFKAAPSDWSPSHSPPPMNSASTEPRGKYVTTNIEDLRVGEWVLARNPEISDQEREEADAGLEDEDTPEWRTIALRMEKPDGDRVNITVVRPLEWLEENAATPGATVELDLEELGAAGPAEVLSIGPCPDIGPPPSPDCRLVTGTFAHQSAKVLDLTIEGLDTRIGVTANHPFWSEDRQQFIPAGDLRIGEVLRALDGRSHRVVSIVPRPGTHSVYNIEVDVEHVYFVSTSGVLVHNEYGRRGAFRAAKRDAGIPKGMQPTRIRRPLMKDMSGRAVLNAKGRPIETREYDFEMPGGRTITIQDHSAGHIGQGPHFNVRPSGDLRHGQVPGTQAHYPFSP